MFLIWHWFIPLMITFLQFDGGCTFAEWVDPLATSRNKRMIKLFWNKVTKLMAEVEVFKQKLKMNSQERKNKRGMARKRFDEQVQMNKFMYKVLLVQTIVIFVAFIFVMIIFFKVWTTKMLHRWSYFIFHNVLLYHFNIFCSSYESFMYRGVWCNKDLNFSRTFIRHSCLHISLDLACVFKKKKFGVINKY